MKINKKYILLILNCEKYRYKAEKQKQSWLKNIDNNIEYFHIIGNKDKCGNCDYLFDNQNNILYTSTLDHYLSLPHKIITAIKAINETYDYEYIFKTDDDQDLVKPLFETIIPLLESSKYHYGGFSVSVPDHYSKYYTIHNELSKDLFLKGTTYCNGRFYLLSKYAVQNLLEKEKEISNQIIEDHAIGLYLDKEYKEKCLILKTHKYFKDT